MSRTSKSPLTVARAAYEVGQKSLPRYAHRYSRRDFTCAQLFAVLVLRKFFKLDYRGTIAFLAEWAELREALDFDSKLPHFTTPQKASAKLLRDPLLRKLLSQTLEQVYRPHATKHRQIDDDDMAWVLRIDRSAADSTGFESGHASKYFTRRKGGKNKGDPPTQATAHRRFPKLAVVAGTDRHVILAIHRTQGPRPDARELLPLMEAMDGRIWPEQMLLDAGYDSEENHALLREVLGIESVIPPRIGRPTHKLPSGKWRWLMATAFDDESYAQRWQVETVMFMLKSRQGEALTARTYQGRRREMGLMAVAHNIMVIAVVGPFYRAPLQPKTKATYF
ncbi:MAG: transposase [Planctomycetota bacterium]